MAGACLQETEEEGKLVSDMAVGTGNIIGMEKWNIRKERTVRRK